MANIYAFQGMVPVIDPTAFVHPNATLIGDVIIGPGVYVGPGASLRGDFGRLILEDGVNFQDNCVMHGFPQSETVIEQDGHIGHGAVIHGCRIRRRALVGMNAVVMDHAVVGEESFVAAMAFVRAGWEIPRRKLVAGIPGKIVRDLSDAEIAWKAEATMEYQELAQRCLEGLHPAEPLTAPEADRPRAYASAIDPLYASKG